MAAIVQGVYGIPRASVGDARINVGIVEAGSGYETDAIAAVVIAGTSMAGGSGSILGTLIGCAIMTVLTNAMVLLRISAYWQNIVVGAIIIFAVSVDTFRRRKLTGERN